MKRLSLFVVLVILWGGLTGCRNADKDCEVIIEPDGEFPQFLVGRWKADKASWELVFGPDGTISSAVINFGRVTMKPGRTTTIPMKMGGKGVFKPGQWLVSYASDNRELIVTISLKSFYMELGDDVLEGKSTNVFAGPVSEDGKLWHVDWISFPDYIAHTPRHPNFRMTEDPNYGILNTLTFVKMSEE